MLKRLLCFLGIHGKYYADVEWAGEKAGYRITHFYCRRCGKVRE